MSSIGAKIRSPLLLLCAAALAYLVLAGLRVLPAPWAPPEPTGSTQDAGHGGGDRRSPTLHGMANGEGQGLPGTAPLVVAIRDASTNAPIKGARVRVGDDVSTTTADGTARLDAVPIHGEYLTVAAAGYKRTSRAVEEPLGEATQIVIRLQPLKSTTCIVLDAVSGRAIAGARVRVYDRSKELDRSGTDRGDGSVVEEANTDASGKVELSHLGEHVTGGKIWGMGVEIRAQDHATSLRWVRDDRVDRGDPVLLYLPREGALRGKVIPLPGEDLKDVTVLVVSSRFAKDEDPLARLRKPRLSFHPLPPHTSGLAFSGEIRDRRIVQVEADGHFHVGDLALGEEYAVIARAGGHNAAQRHTARAGQSEVSEPITIHLERAVNVASDADSATGDHDSPTHSVAGVVLDETGQPIPGVRLEARPGAGKPCMSDEHGRFALETEATGQVTIHARAAGFGEAFEETTLPPADDVTIRLGRLGKIIAEVVVPDGVTPPEALWIYWWCGGQRAGREVKWIDRREKRQSLSIAVWPGYGITFEISASKFQDKASENFEVLPGEDLDLGELGLVPGLRLLGRVVDSEGRPLEHVAIDGKMEDPINFFQAKTSTDGSFRIQTLPPGLLSVTAKRGGYLSAVQEVTIRDQATHIELALTRMAVIRGRVFDDAKQPVVDCEVVARPTEQTPEGYGASRYTDVGGYFQMEVPAGSYVVEVPARSATGARDQAPQARSSVLRVLPGDQETVELKVRR